MDGEGKRCYVLDIQRETNAMYLAVRHILTNCTESLFVQGTNSFGSLEKKKKRKNIFCVYFVCYVTGKKAPLHLISSSDKPGLDLLKVEYIKV